MKTDMNAGQKKASIFQKGLTVLCCMLLTLTVLLPVGGEIVLADGEEVYLTWDEYVEANGITDWNYNDQAEVIAEVAAHAVSLYEAGQNEEAYEYAKATY